MLFKWLNKQGVESSSGYMLQRMGRFYYHYKEGDHVMRVNIEPGVEYQEIVWDKTVRWEPPHDSERVSSEQITAIEKNISDALTFMCTAHIFK
jgi:hypothetical protein